MQPYRLEMGTRLVNPRGSNLYAFWGDTPTAALNRLLDGEREAGGEAVLVNSPRPSTSRRCVPRSSPDRS